MIKVAVSGYFLFLHIGHAQLFHDARSLGHSLTVIVNNDRQQLQKYGKIIVPADQRAKLIRSFRVVDFVFISVDDDSSVCESLKAVRPDIFYNGGDRTSIKDMNQDEVKVCHEIDCMIMSGSPEKLNSSSSILRKIRGEE